ncbi:tRNA 2-thiocytidine biosynthesis TtcA family protein [Rubeoparvulum massiliense]|uniref:tRNA 2-thiocytidine biosynthesis TtcA family protein n=1 Tax=Rubeoparvulum massiliense TaxID=1631346 RepID=UPI000B09C193|nr:tRNA 2-thiocytidine biosynthesis TtcA family protein [Rubeoparvulum massiliense]
MDFHLSNQDRQQILTPLKQMIQQYQLIDDGDKIAVGLSGGKDSTSLLYLLTILQQQRFASFQLVPITLDLGFQGLELVPLRQFVEELGHSLEVVSTQIGSIVFETRQEKNPCSLCANMRRGTLYDAAQKAGCNKVALGHHLDDALETFMMNLFFNGKLGTFPPSTFLDRTNITLIRPMIAVEERMIKKLVRTKALPVIENPCPANKHTKREEMKKLVQQLSISYPDLRQQFLHGVQHVDGKSFW